jgi:hypothetical protein
MAFDPNSTILAGIEAATLRQWLSDAQAALQGLMTGRREVTVAYDGKSVTYSNASRSDLQMWIMQLQRQLGTGGRRGALRPYFR